MRESKSRIVNDRERGSGNESCNGNESENGNGNENDSENWEWENLYAKKRNGFW